MKNGRNRLIAWSCLLALPFFSAVGFAQPSPAGSNEENAGYGYHLKDGTPSLEMDTAAVFAPDQGLIVVDPSNEKAVQESFKATDLGDGAWSIPDPETGIGIVTKVQHAASVYTDNPGNVTPTQTSLKVVAKSEVSVLALFAPRIWRLRLGYLCDTVGSCPGGCQNGDRYVPLNRHLVCRWTGRPWHLCLDYLLPVCRVDHYTCRDCTGPILWQALNLRYVCATF